MIHRGTVKYRIAVLALAVGAQLLGPARPASSAWIFDAGTDVLYESNVGFASLPSDIKGDAAFAAAMSVGPALLLDDGHIFSLTGDVTGKLYQYLHGLDNAAVGLTGTYKKKFGLGAEAPWARAFGSIARQEYDNDVRDSWVYRLGAGTGKRFDRWDLRADYTFERRMGDHAIATASGIPGNVFDLTSHTFAGRADFLYSETVTIWGGYALRSGDVVSTTRRNGQIFVASDAITKDRTFGSDFFAYKLDAMAHIFSAGLSVALGERSSVHVGYDYVSADARKNITYQDSILRFGFLYSY
jgi:hypothetical protein